MPGEGRSENLGEIGTDRDIYCYADRGWSISKEKISATPWYQNPCNASVFLHINFSTPWYQNPCDASIFLKKTRTKFDLSSGSSHSKI